VRTLHNDVDFLTLKYDPNGHLLWRARYNGPGNDVDRARSIAMDKDGNVYVTGESDNGKGNGLTRLSGLDWATIKYDKDGHQIWVARYNGPDDGEDWPLKVCVDWQGCVYVAGYSVRKRHNRGRTIMPCEWTLVKYDPMGRQLWVQRERAPEDWSQSEAIDMVVDSPGNVYVTGWIGTAHLGPSRADLLTIKYNSDGECLWRRTYSGNGIGNVFPCRIALDGSGHVYVAGKQYDGDLMNNGTQMDIVTLKYDADGNRNWVRVYDNGHQDDIPQALAVNAAGDACVVGSTTPSGGTICYLSLWYDPNGSHRWATAYKGTANMSDYAMDVAIDPAGDMVVTGRATDAVRNRHAGTASDLDLRADNVTLKYDPTGRALWKGVYEGGVGWGADPCMVAIDNQDCVIVAGQSDQGNNTPVITVIKYAAEASP
ncbi:MAG TPA: SBBP repeat-containing protein, partial [Chthonomonadaceae bacterium]|nr:SBBP repeat-containing protein [Chthonomonadaceae bacterium]